jgi:hypothetical protein
VNSNLRSSTDDLRRYGNAAELDLKPNALRLNFQSLAVNKLSCDGWHDAEANLRIAAGRFPERVLISSYPCLSVAAIVK